MSNVPETLEVRVKSISYEAAGIISLDLRRLDGGELPTFTAGSHIDLHLSNGLIRSYSLVNPQRERHRYVIAVNKDRASRGGSRFVHEKLRVGERIKIAGPRNNFPLAEDAGHSVFIAGGIGITPLWCMIQRLEELGRSWELHYCARDRESAAFTAELGTLGDRVRFNFDGEPGGKMLDLPGLVSEIAPDAHVYCCGPVSMLSAFENATSGRAPETVHVEYFAAKEAPATEGGFTVVLARSGRTVVVEPGKTILDTLLEEGIEVAYACMEGVCGTCETKVLEGVPEHRDLVLSKEEQAANRTMMICCSGSKTATLVLDL